MDRRRWALALIGPLIVGAGLGAALVAGDGGDPPIAGSTVAAPAPTADVATGLGTINDQLARLPALRPGDLEGVLDFAPDGCSTAAIDLATLERRAFDPGVPDACGPPGSAYGVRLTDASPTGAPLALEVIDATGQALKRISVPAGWDLWGLATDGLVLCDAAGARGQLRRFTGGTERLPGCPLARSASNLVFAGKRRRSLIDADGRQLVALRAKLRVASRVRSFGDGLISVDDDLYGRGRHLARVVFPPSFVQVVAASRDGRVILVADETQGRLAVIRDGVSHAIDPVLANVSGAVAPDGRRILLERSSSLLIELDAATLRPVARLGLDPPGDLVDWRPSARG